MQDFLWACAGFAFVNACFILYFAAHGALRDYIVDAFLINRYYSNQGLLEWFHALLEAIEFTNIYPLLAVAGIIGLGFVLTILLKYGHFIKRIWEYRFIKWAFLGIGLLCFGFFGLAQLRGGTPGIGLLESLALISGLIFLSAAVFGFFRGRRPLSESLQGQISLRENLAAVDQEKLDVTGFLFIGTLDFTFVIFLISAAGMNFDHYFISLFPPVLLLITGIVTYLGREIPVKYGSMLKGGIIALVIFVAFEPALQIINRLEQPGSLDKRGLTAEYLKSVTTPDDKVLVWGWEAGINFLADRESPTRYAFQFPAYASSPYQQEVIDTLYADITSSPPKYIADTQESGMPFIEGRSMADCLSANPLDGYQLHAILNFVCSNYELDRAISTVNIYKLIQ